jgi:hypothetical protein
MILDKLQAQLLDTEDIVKLKGNQSKVLPNTFRLVNGDLFGPRLSHRATDPNYEDFFCGPKGPIRRMKFGRNLPRFVTNEIKRLHQLRKEYKMKPISWSSRSLCTCAPIYEPQWWNDGNKKQSSNNCYNYATNYRTDTFA